jgi:hypothetical protein
MPEKQQRRLAAALAYQPFLQRTTAVTCKAGEYSIVHGLNINEFSREKMTITHRELSEERDGVKDLL